MVLYGHIIGKSILKQGETLGQDEIIVKCRQVIKVLYHQGIVAYT